MAERSYEPVEVSQDILDRFKKLPVATIWSYVHNAIDVPLPFMERVYPYTKGQRLAARARTLRFLPPRPDLIAEKRRGADAPEYHAMTRCGPGDVLVADMHGASRSCIFGDVKALQLKMNNAEGIVTDGGIRDLGVMEDEDYGLIIYAGDRTPYITAPWGEPAEENVDIQCGGVLVRPKDVLVGDDDGIVVVPSWFAEECVSLVEEQEEIESFIKEKILAEGCVPGKYYPATPQIRKEFQDYKDSKAE